MRRNILKAAEEGRKTMTERAELTVGELQELMNEALQRNDMECIPVLMTDTQAGNLIFDIIGLCFDAGYAIGLRKGKRISRAKRTGKAVVA